MTVLQLARTPIGMLTRLRARGGDEAARQPMTTSALLVLVCTVALLAFGLIMILSASWVTAFQNYGSSFVFFRRQVAWAAIGVVAMLITSRIDYRRFRLASYVLLLGTIVGLVLVLIPGVGVRVDGSARWLNLGIARIQPSELAKLALLLVGADLCTRKGPRLRTFKDVMLPFGAIALLLGGLVMLQPDLGTTVILGGIAAVVLFVAGTRGRVLAGMGACALGGFGLLSMSAGYRRARLEVFTNPFRDPLNAGYQAVQGQIALGSGGLFGVGLGASRQKWLYVPNAHTDFIFAIIGEEVGLLGTFAVIALFALLIYAGVRTARRAADPFGRIVAGAITCWIGGQAVINMGAVTGLLPITGVPLPLVSFGGSSLVFTLAGLGILANIGRQEVWPPVKETPAPRARSGRPPAARPSRSAPTSSSRGTAPSRGATTSGRTARPSGGTARPSRATGSSVRSAHARSGSARAGDPGGRWPRRS